jgi:hypothetical protein
VSLQRALAIQEKTLNPKSEVKVGTLLHLAEAQLQLGDRTAAAALTERAAGLAQSEVNRAMVQFEQARELMGRDRVRARALGESARDCFAGLGCKRRLIEVQRWLEQHS